MTTIPKNFPQEVQNVFKDCFSGTDLKLFCKSINEFTIDNPDGSKVYVTNINFSEYPIDNDDNDESMDIYSEESDRFQKAFIEAIQKAYQIELTPLEAEEGHYFYNHDGDTISIHFNDESLIFIETYTGQY